MIQGRLFFMAGILFSCASGVFGQLAAPTIVNPSFEQDHFTNTPGRIRENGPITGWFSSSSTGLNPLADGSSPLADNGTIPSGRQTAFIQGNGSMVQSIGGFVVGYTYQLRYSENACEQCSGLPNVSAILGADTVIAEHPVNPVGGTNRYRTVVSSPFVASQENMDLIILNNSPTAEATVLLDNIRLIVLSTGSVSYALVPLRSVWKYLDNGSDQGTAWQAIDFDDSTWASGPAQLGYGDGDEATVVSYGPNSGAKYPTTYFRRSFNLPDPTPFTALTVRLMRDDGGIVYLNGVEIFRSNMPDGFVNYQTFAASTIPNSDESVLFANPVDPSVLVSGKNVLAVEIHQANFTSSDISFELDLVGLTSAGPPAILMEPQDQIAVTGGSATFSVKALGTLPLNYQWQVHGRDLPGATNALLRLSGLGPTDEGDYRVTITNTLGSVVSETATLTLAHFTGDLFQIASLTAKNPRAIEHFNLTGDDRGGIAASASQVFVTGDSSTARFNLYDLSGGTRIGQLYDSLASDLRTGRIFLLANGSSPLASPGGTANALLEVDGETGLRTTNAIALSAPIDLSACSGCVGIFSGFGRIVLHNGTHAFAILLPSGEVQDLGAMASFRHTYSENWAYWGVAEYFGGANWLVCVRDYQTIARTRVPDGVSLPVATFTNLSDMASFTVSPLLKRWYFHHQYTSQFRSGTETVGYANASFAHEQQPQPPAILIPPRGTGAPDGGSASFTVLALGYPLTYQWLFNEKPIIGATNQTLALAAVSGAQVGLYSVRVANTLGSIISAPAFLNVTAGGTAVSSVAILGAEPTSAWNEDVRKKIELTGQFSRVDALQVSGGFPVPILDQLQQYDAVLVYSDYGFNDPTAIGNLLADYVDSGRGLVLASFLFNGSLAGRIASGNYLPFSTANVFAPGGLALVPDEPSHRLLEGVLSFQGGLRSYLNSPTTVVPGAELIAHWNNGQPLVAVKPVGKNAATLLSYWPFDGNAAATRGVNGTLVGTIAAAPDRNGVAGGALAFSGSQYVSVAGGGGLNAANAGTVSMWVKWSGTQDADCCGSFGAVLARQANGLFSDDILALDAADPSVARIVWRQSGGPAPTLITGTTVVGTTWHHVAVTFAPGGSSLYLDGAAQTTAIGSALNNNSGIALAIGAWPGDGSGFSSASIDDVAIWDEPLRASQISQLANQSKTPLDFLGPETTVSDAGDDPTNRASAVVGLNFFPPSSDASSDLWDVRTDGAQLMANALSFGDNATTVPLVSPGIRTQPSDVSVLQGLDGRFEATPYGSPPLAFQWIFANVPIANATNRILLLANAQPEQSGGYSVVVSNSYGAVTSRVANLLVYPTRGIAGYYTDYNISSTGPEQSIISALFTPLRIGDISTVDLDRLSILLINETQGSLSSPLHQRLRDIQEWVSRGGKLIVHQRSFYQNTLPLNPFLLGSSGTRLIYNYTTDINVIPPGGTLVTDGPHGGVDNLSLDNGPIAVQAAVDSSTLPLGSTAILNGTPDVSRVVAFAYQLGNGLVYFSTIPLDYYLDGFAGQPSQTVRNIYLPNVLEYAAAYAAVGPPQIFNGPDSALATVGGTASFLVSTRGQTPLSYQWYFNGSPINGATNNPLRLTNVSSTDAGSYSVGAINALGMANSSAATLNVVTRVSVGLFSDPEFITTQNVQNLAATLGQFGHAVRPFSNLPAGITNDVVIFPQIGNAPLSPQLDSGSRALLQAYVLQGGVLISQGGYNNFDLINNLFGFSLSTPGYYSGIQFTRTSQAVGTPFTNAPAALDANYYTYPLYPASLPQGARSIYQNSTYNFTALALIPYGAGAIIYMGWDWSDAVPLGSQDGGWPGALASAVQNKGISLPGPLTVFPLVSTGSTWKYLDNGTDQGTAWRELNFDDSAWASGPAQLGYGDGDEATVVSFGPDPNQKFTTTYFRRSFTFSSGGAVSNSVTLTNAGPVGSLLLRLLRDDGAAVYLNGVEIVRDCLPPAATYNTFATCVIAGSDETQFLSFPADAGLLRNGRNVLAVEIHQANFTSSDISFDLELLGSSSSATPVIRTQPASQTVASQSTVVLSVVAGGSLPLNYQWRFNDQILPGATNAILFLSGVTTNNSGSYFVQITNPLGSVQSSNAMLNVMTLEGPSFRIANLSTNGATVIDHTFLTGYEHGAIAASSQELFFSGNNGTARFALADLSGGTPVGHTYDALASDLLTETVYSLANGNNVLSSDGRILTGLLEVDGLSGALTGGAIQLSAPIELSNPLNFSGRVGIFPGLGRIVLHDGRRAWNIDLPSGRVVELGQLRMPPHLASQSGPYWGVAEFFDGAIWLVFVSNSQTILRMRVSDGFTETAGRFDNLSSMPSITVSLPLRRWYFHHQYGSQFAPYYQAVGFADAEFESSLPAVGPVIVKQPRDQTVGASGTAVFTVVARGTGPLQYQWLVDGAPLAGATNSTLTLTQLSTDQSARYSVQIVNTAGSVLSSDAQLRVVSLGTETFRITSLSTNDARVADDSLVAGSDYAAIAATAQRIFYTGRDSTAGFDIANLSGASSVGRGYDALVSELGNEKVYALADGTNVLSAVTGGALSALLELDGATGQLTGRRIELSESIELGNQFNDIGFFAGLSRIVVCAGAQVWTVELPSGQVLRLGPMKMPPHAVTEANAYWGVAEFFDGAIRLVYVRDSQTIVRTRVPDGQTETVASFNSLSDMAAITVSLPYNRWYFHHQYSSQFSYFNGTIGFADASFVSSLPATSPAIVQNPLDKTIGLGGTVTFDVTAKGTGPLQYQWLLEGSPVPGATNLTLKLTNVTSAQAGRYAVLVRNAQDAVTSGSAMLRVIPSVAVSVFDDPAFIYPEHSANVRASLALLGHHGTSFTAIDQAATGTAPLLFPAFEADDLARTLSVANRDALQNFVAQGGVVIVHGANNDPARPVRFLNSVWDFGIANASSFALLTRSPAAQGTSFANDPDWLPFNAYSTGLLPSSLPEGTLSLYENAGESSVALIRFGAGKIIFLGWNWADAAPQGRQDGGWLDVLRSAIEETGPPAATKPEILAQPQSQTAIVGATAQIRLLAAGYPLAYQWFFKNQPLAGATNYILLLSSVTTNNSGVYSVTVSNSLGLVTSSNATLDVVRPLFVGVYDNGSFVDTSGGPYAESDTVQASLAQLRHIVRPFTSITLGVTNQVVVIPRLKFGDPAPSLDAASRTALLSFVQRGGVLISHGDYANVSFLNTLFGLSLNIYGYVGGIQFNRAAEAIGLPFASGPSTLPYNQDTLALLASSLPALGGRELYRQNDSEPCAVALITYGAGSIIYMGWDWYDAAPLGTQDSGWLATLGNAVLTRIAPRIAPVITQAPEGLTLLAGQNATFSMRGYGGGPLQVRWLYNGQALLGAANATLTLPFVQTSQSGAYQVVLTNPSGSATSTVANLLVRPTRGLVGYYGDFLSLSHSIEDSVLSAGFTPLLVSDISSYDLSRLNLLMIEEYDSGALSPALLARLPAIQSWVLNGGRLIIHDWLTSVTPGQPNPSLLAANTVLVSAPGNDLESFPPGDNPVIVGPHGTLSGTSLDGGNWSFDGYAQRSTLPPGAVPILSAGLNTDQILAFSYGLGAGAIYYATLPLTPLISRSDQLGTTVRTIYTPNLIEYAGSFSASGPPQLLADPRNIENFSGGSATLIVAANGQALQYQWLFNDAPIAGATNAILAFSGLNTNQAGSYKVIVSNALASLTSGVAIVTIVQAVPFRITLLGADSSKVVDHNLITGDDRGGIAISRTHVFYTGDEHTGSFVASDLTGGVSLPIQYDALVSNLRNGTVYSLANETNLITGAGNVTRLIEINGDTGVLTTNTVPLSSAIPLGSDTGIFAGYDAIVLNSGGRVYRIELPSGFVMDLGPMLPYAHSSCENWAYWGVSEFFGGSVYLDYVRDYQTIMRTRVPDGATTVLGSFSNLGDMCSFTFSVPFSRWYFHYEGNAQFGGLDETLGYATAAFDRPPRIITVLTNRVINEDTSTGPINFFVQDEAPARLIASASSSNPTLVPNTNIVFAGTNTAHSFAITPAPDEFGTTLITITVTDEIGQSTNRTFTLTVNPVNDRPFFNRGPDVVALEDSGPRSLPNWATGIAAGPQNETNQALTFVLTNNNPSLFASQPLISPEGTLLFTPAADSNGVAAVTVRLQDDGGTTNGGRDTSLAQTFNITIAPVNDPPGFIKGPDLTVLEDSGPQVVPQWATGLRAGPLDESAQTLTFIVRSISNPGLFAAQPAITANGTLTFTPGPNANGAASITMVLQDNGGTANGGSDTSNPQTFLITVQPVNDPPVANPQSLTVAEDTSLAITLTGFDIDLDPLSFSVISPPAHGTLSGAGAKRLYQPATNFFGADSFTVKANDGLVDSAEATITINVTPVNDPPVADSQSWSGPEDAPLAITLTGSDVEGDSLTYNVVTFPAHGTLSGSGANRIYQPATNFFGGDSFTFKVNDGQLDSAPATVTLSITPVNDPPLANSRSLTNFIGRPTPITLTGSDVDGDPLSFKILTAPAHGTLSGSDATRFYQAVTNFSGADSFTFVANDGQLDSAPATVTITVIANHPPVAVIAAPAIVLLTPDSTNGVAISPNNTNATVVIDGSQSHDADSDTLTFAWFEGDAAAPFAAGTLVSNLFNVGSHTIKLIVNDGKDSGTADLNFGVITSEDAVLRVMRFLSSSPLARKNRHDLLNTLETAAELFARAHFSAAVSRLRTFQNKVRAQVARDDSALAAALIQAVQQIIDGQTVLSRLLLARDMPRGNLRFTLFGEAGCFYRIESSTNLLDWTVVTTFISVGGTNDFTDSDTSRFNQRFYRAVFQPQDE